MPQQSTFMRTRLTNPFNAQNGLIRLFCLTIVLAILGCSQPKLAPLDADSRILAFGDSLTYGYGAPEGKSYPAILSKLSGLEVINSGVSGETTDIGLLRLEQELERVQPELLILIEGGNDILRNHSPESIKANLAAMIKLARSHDIPVVLIGVPEKKLFSNAAPIYEELATENQLVFDGTLLGKLLRNPAYKSDLVHLNEQGYQAMAKDIYQLLVKNGAL